MQAERNEQAVEEAVEARADRAEPDHPLTERDEAAEQDRPHEVQHECDSQGCTGRDDRDGALAGEERERRWELHVLELVVAVGADEAADDADERILDAPEADVDVLNRDAL